MLYDGAAGSLSAEEERALQERGLELLNARRADPHAPQYTPEDAAALRTRGASLLQAHQAHQRNTPVATPPASSTHTKDGPEPVRDQPSLLTPLRHQYDNDAQSIADLHSTVASLQATIEQQAMELDALRAANASSPSTTPAHASSELIPVEEAERAKQALLEQFSAHMEECNKANQDYWSQAQAQHQQELAALTESRDALQARVGELESALSQAQAHHAEAVADLQAELTRSAEACRSLQDRCDALTAQLDDARQREAALDGVQRALEAADARVEEITADAEQRVTAAQEAIAALERELAARDAALQDSHAAQRALSEQLAAATTAAAVTMEATQSQVVPPHVEAAYQKQIDDLLAQVAALEHDKSAQPEQQAQQQLLPSSSRASEGAPVAAVPTEQQMAIAPANPFASADTGESEWTAAVTDGWGEDQAAQDLPAGNPFRAHNPLSPAVADPRLTEAQPSAEAEVERKHGSTPSPPAEDVRHLEEDILRLQQALDEERQTHAEALSVAQQQLAATAQALDEAQRTSEAARDALEAQLAEARSGADVAASERDAALAEAHAMRQAMAALPQQPPCVQAAPNPFQSSRVPAAAAAAAAAPTSAWDDGWDFDDEPEGSANATSGDVGEEAPFAAPETSAVNPFASSAAAPVGAHGGDEDVFATEGGEDLFGAHTTDEDPFAAQTANVFMPSPSGLNPFTTAATPTQPTFVDGAAEHQEMPPTPPAPARPAAADEAEHAANARRVVELEAALQVSEEKRQDLACRVAALEAGQAALSGDADMQIPTHTTTASTVTDALPRGLHDGAGVERDTEPDTLAGTTARCSTSYDEGAIPTSPSSVAIDDTRRPPEFREGSTSDHLDKNPFHIPCSNSDGDAATEVAADDELLELRERVRSLEAQLTAMQEPLAAVHQPTVASAASEDDLAAEASSGMQTLGRQFADVQHRLACAQEENASLREEVNTLRQQCGLSPVVSNSEPPSQVTRVLRGHATAPGEATTLVQTADEGSFGTATDINWGAPLNHTLPPAEVERQSRRRSLGDSCEDVVVENEGESSGQPRAHAGALSSLDNGPNEDDEAEMEEIISVSTRAAARHRTSPGEEQEANQSNEEDDIEDVDEHDDGAMEEATPTEVPHHRIRGRAQRPFEDTAEAMAELGRRYADAQHQLMRADDARAVLEADLAEAQRALAAMADAHEAELEQLAAEAEARINEIEDLSRQRIEELEDNLKAAQDAAWDAPGENRAPTTENTCCSAMSDQLAALQAQTEAQAQTLREAESQLARALTELEAALAAKSTAEAEKKELEAEMEAMVDQFEMQMNERDKLLQQRLDEMEAEHRLEQESALAEAARSPVPPVSGEETEASKRVVELQAALADREDALEQLRGRLQQLQSEYDAFVEDTRQRREARELRGEEEEASQAAASHESTAKQLAALHARLEAMSSHMDAAQRDVAEREAECAALRDQLDEQAASHANAIKQLEANLESRRREVHDLSVHNDELTNLLQDGATSVEAALADRERELKALRAELEANKRHTAELGDALSQKEEALATARAEQADMHRTVTDAESARRDLQQQLQAAQQAADRHAREGAQQAERARRELERLQHEHDEELAHALEAHQAELAASRAAADKLKDELQVAQTMAATLPLEGKRFQNQFDSLRQQLESALSENAQLHKTLRETRAVQGSGATSASPSTPDGNVNALLTRADTLEARCRELQKDKNTLLQDKDDLTVQALKAERIAEVKEQALRRQEEEVQYCRSQLASLQGDLGQRARANQALQSELENVHDHAAAVAAAYEDLQASMAGLVHEHALAGHAEGLLYAKARTIPLLLDEYLSAVFAGYTGITRAVQIDRAQLAARCNAIEETANEAMMEGERQIEAYQATLADAQEEQATLVRTIESLREDLHTAEQGLVEAVEELKAARVEVREVKRAAHEEVFAAQRDQQAVTLEHADTLHSLALLQEEMDGAARILQKQKEQYEARMRQLEKDVELAQEKLQMQESQIRAARSADDDGRAELLARVEAAERRRDEAERDARGVRAQLERAMPRLAQLEEDHARRSAELIDTAQQLSALSKKTNSEGAVTQRFIHDLSVTSQELVAANAALKKANVMSEAAIERLKAGLGEVQHENEQLRVQRDQQARDLDAITRKANELDVKYARDVTEVQSRQRDLDRHVSALEERNSHLQEGEQQARRALREAEQELATTADALARATEAHENTSQQLTRQVNSLRERCAGLEDELAALQQRHNEIHTDRDAMDRDLQAAQREVDRLKQHLDAANEHNEALNEQLRYARVEQTEARAGVQQSLEDAQKELQRCRKVLAEAEARQLGLESDLYLVQSERDKLQQELQASRAATQKAQELYKKEQFERQEMAATLQDQVARLYEEVRGGQNTIRGLAAQLEQQRDQNNVLLDEVKEANERSKAQRVECECVKDALATAKEDHRRERYDLQSKVRDADEALAEERLAADQYHRKMTNKVEMYEVTEAALRQEIADLRRDVAELEASLAMKSRGAATTERDQSRQFLSLQNAEEELNFLRAQGQKDATEIAELKKQLQQRTAELERCTRDLASQRAQIHAELEEQHQATIDALTAQCRKANQALEEARAGRDHAIQSSQIGQKQLEECESRCAELEDALRARQRELELLRHQLQSIHLVAQQAAQEAALPADTESREGVSSEDVPKVIDGLLAKVRQFTHGATSLELERQQYDELDDAVEAHQLLMKRIAQLAAQPFHTPAGAAAAQAMLSGVAARRPRTARGTSFLIDPSSHLEEGTPALLTDGAEEPDVLVWHPSQQNMAEQLQGVSVTLSHRLQAHLHTTHDALETLAAALSGTTSSSLQRGAQEASGTTPAATAARKAQLAATMLELQRRMGSANRALERVVDTVVAATRHSQSGEGMNASTLSGVSPIRQSPAHAHNVSHGSEEPYAALTSALVDAIRTFGEVERVVLRPYNELLSGVAAPGSASPSSAMPTYTQAFSPPASQSTRPGQAPATPAGRTTPPADGRSWF